LRKAPCSPTMARKSQARQLVAHATRHSPASGDAVWYRVYGRPAPGDNGLKLADPIPHRLEPVIPAATGLSRRDMHWRVRSSNTRRGIPDKGCHSLWDLLHHLPGRSATPWVGYILPNPRRSSVNCTNQRDMSRVAGSCREAPAAGRARFVPRQKPARGGHPMRSGEQGRMLRGHRDGRKPSPSIRFRAIAARTPLVPFKRRGGSNMGFAQFRAACGPICSDSPSPPPLLGTRVPERESEAGTRRARFIHHA
jgi:hypothetical protein